jgi:hypothetical protein
MFETRNKVTVTSIVFAVVLLIIGIIIAFIIITSTGSILSDTETTTGSDNFVYTSSHVLSGSSGASTPSAQVYNQTWLNFDGTTDWINLSNSNQKLSLSKYRISNVWNTTIGFHQGLARDSTYFFFFDTYNVSKFFMNNLTYVNSNSNLPSGTNHTGDGDYCNGNLYVPTEFWAGCGAGISTNFTITVYNSDNLTIMSNNNITSTGFEAGSVTLNDDCSLAYVISFCNKTSMMVFNTSNYSNFSTITLSRNVTASQSLELNGNNIYINGLSNPTEYTTTQLPQVHMFNINGTLNDSIWIPNIQFTSGFEGLDWNGTNLVVTYDLGSYRRVEEIIPSRGNFVISFWYNSSFLPNETSQAFERLVDTIDDRIACYTHKATSALICKVLTLEGGNGLLKPYIYSYNITKNKYNNIVFSYNNSNLSIWLNGVLINSTLRDGKGAISNFTWQISSNSGGFFNGTIDEIRFYGDGLTDNQILQINNSGRSKNNSLDFGSLLAYYSMNENSGATTYDSSGNGNNGTISGATWQNDGVLVSLTNGVDYSVEPYTGIFTILNPVYQYSYIMTSWVQGTIINTYGNMKNNFTAGVDKVSAKIPILFLVLIVVVIMGVIALLVAAFSALMKKSSGFGFLKGGI